MVHLGLLCEFTFLFREKYISVLFDHILLQIFFLPRLHRLTCVDLTDLVNFHHDFWLLWKILIEESIQCFFAVLAFRKVNRLNEIPIVLPREHVHYLFDIIFVLHG